MSSKISRQKEHFNNIANQYYIARQNPNSLRYKELLWKYIFQFFPSTKSISVLEPMCGYGEGEYTIKSCYCQSVDYTGFDFSERLIEIIKKNTPNKHVFVQDVTTFIPEDKYDLIWLIGGLHHVPDYSFAVLKNLCKGLNNNSLLVNFEPTHSNAITKKIRSHIYRSNHIFDETTERDFSVNELNNMYKNAGLEIVCQFYPGLLSYCLYYNPDAFPRLASINPVILNSLFALEKPFYRTSIAKFFSFATLTVLKKCLKT